MIEQTASSILKKQHKKRQRIRSKYMIFAVFDVAYYPADHIYICAPQSIPALAGDSVRDHPLHVPLLLQQQHNQLIQSPESEGEDKL